LLEEAEIRAKELEKEREAREMLNRKLEELQKKVMVGGVNILDQHQQQQIELAKKAHALEEEIRRQRELERVLNEKDENGLLMEEKYTNLQEEAVAKTKKLKRVWNIYNEHKSELKDIKQEQVREREDLLETVREMTSEIKLRLALIEGFIPAEELAIIYDCSEYDPVAEKWKIAQIAHAGNNIKGKRSFAAHINQKGQDHLNREIAEDDPDLNWDPMVPFAAPYLSYDVPSLKKKEGKIGLKIGKKTSKQPEEPKVDAPKARGLVAKAKHYA
jgi:hypothetical protein